MKQKTRLLILMNEQRVAKNDCFGAGLASVSCLNLREFQRNAMLVERVYSLARVKAVGTTEGYEESTAEASKKG